MDNVEAFFQAEQATYVYGSVEIVFNLAVAFALGMIVSWVYKKTHKGLSYSQSFMLTTVFVTVIVAMVIMVIGNNLARAFALVGALSIIRFRTVVKDTKDTAYVFWALATGLAAGTSNYFLAIAGTLIIATIAFLLDSTNYGTLYKSEFIVRFRVDNSGETVTERYNAILQKFSKHSSLLHVDPSGDGKSSKLTLDIVMRTDLNPSVMASELALVDGVTEVNLVASKTDIDY